MPWGLENRCHPGTSCSLSRGDPQEKAESQETLLHLLSQLLSTCRTQSPFPLVILCVSIIFLPTRVVSQPQLYLVTL